jgi:hypothetical protein
MQKHLSPGFAKSGRTDTNPIESMHSAYYQIADSDNPLVYGLFCLMLFGKNLDFEFKDLLEGRTVRYGILIFDRMT